MAWAHVQDAHNSDGAVANVTSFSATFGVAVGSGNLVVGVVTWDSASGQGTLNTVTDNKGNTYTISDSINSAGDTQQAASFSLGNVTGGPTVITANFTSTGGGDHWITIVVSEYSGGPAAADFRDGHTGQLQTAVGTGANAISSGNITTTANGDLIWGATVSPTSTPTATAGTGFTLRGSDITNTFTYDEDQVQTTAGSIAATFTASASAANWITFLIAFKITAGDTFANNGAIFFI